MRSLFLVTSRLIAKRLEGFEFGNQPQVLLTSCSLLGSDQTLDRKDPALMTKNLHFLGRILDIFVGAKP